MMSLLVFIELIVVEVLIKESTIFKLGYFLFLHAMAARFLNFITKLTLVTVVYHLVPDPI